MMKRIYPSFLFPIREAEDSLEFQHLNLRIMPDLMHMIPLMIDLAGKKVVIFGGGEVGARKARFFAPEAEVTVISRSFSPLLSSLTIQRVTRELSDLREEEIWPMLDGSVPGGGCNPGYLAQQPHRERSAGRGESCSTTLPVSPAIS